MPDRTEIDEQERDQSSSTTDQLSESESDWSAESALPEGDELGDDLSTEDEAADDGSTDTEGEASDADDTDESEKDTSSDEKSPDESEGEEETSGDDDSRDDGEPTADASADGDETAVLQTVGDEQEAAETTVAADTSAAETASDEEQESKKRSWVPWLVGSPILIAIALVVGFLIADLGGDRGNPGSANDPKLRGEQASWEIRTYVVGGRYVDGAPKTTPEAVERDLSEVITGIHDALFLRPSRLDAVTKKYFSSAAAKVFGKTKIGIPKNADEVQTTHRFARIGVDGAGAGRAAALVQVAAKGKAGSQTFRSSAESKLFLERTDSGWKVIGYEVQQRPGNPFDEDKGKKQTDDKKGDPKKGDSKKKAGDGRKGKGKK